MSNYKSGGAAWGGGWFLGFIGAAVYYLQTAHSFWSGIWGIIKAIFWPGFLVYYLFHFLRV
jgi:hypothetical protein